MYTRRGFIRFLNLIGMVYWAGPCSQAFGGWPGGNHEEDQDDDSDPIVSPRHNRRRTVRRVVQQGGCSWSSASNITPFVYSNNIGISPQLYQVSLKFNQEVGDQLGVYPGFMYFNDSGQPNAYATQERLLPTAEDGTILFGTTLIMQEMQMGVQTVGGAMALIHAHEIGHIAQFKYGYNASTKTKELQADAIAGGVLAKRMGEIVLNNPSKLALLRGELMHASQSLFSKGDYLFNHPSHHGTPQQRLIAFQNGMKLIFENEDMESSELLEKTFKISQRLS